MKWKNALSDHICGHIVHLFNNISYIKKKNDLIFCVISYSNITLLVWLYIVLGFGYSFIMTWQKWYKSCFILWTYQLINIELFGHRYSTIVFVCVVTYVWTNHFQPTISWHQATFTHSSTELRFTVSRHRSYSRGTISSARQTIL